jgi:predicted ATPase/DNA-binding CsgD family transcriptional regulator
MTHRAGVGNLPYDTTAFIGRRHLLRDIGTALTRSRLVTLTGTGGVGKTRAAIQFGRIHERAVPGGIWLVDLVTVHDPEILARLVAATLGIHDQSQRPTLDTLVTHLSERPPLLLVLDNCEHLVDAAAALADTLLRHTADVRILATSRQPLNIAGEHLVHVPPMDVPTTAEVDAATSVDALAHHDAVRLFLDRVTDADVTLSDQDTHAVGQLVRALQGVPLTLELAAARTTTLSPDQILRRVDDPLRVLTSTDRAPHPPHHHSLATTLDWSYHLCTPAEQCLWARLAVFTGSVDLAAVDTVCTDDQLPAADIVTVLDGLARQSLLTVQRGSGGVRYRMLETVRAYGLDRLTDHGDEPDMRRRHRDYYQAVTEHAASDHQSHRELDWMTRLRDELPNIRAALTSALDSGDVDTGLRIIDNINRARGWFFAGTLSEARYWSRTLLAHHPGSPLRLRILAGGAWIAICQGDRRSALSIIAECLRIARDEHPPSPSTAAVLAFLTGTYHTLSRADVARATGHLIRARDGFLCTGHADEAHMARLCLAIATALAADPDAAFAAAQDCLNDAQTTGAPWAISWAQWAYGLAHLRHGDPRRAATLFTTALTTQHQTGDHWGPPWSIAALGWHAATTGNHTQAALLAGAAHRQRHLVGVDIHGITLLAILDTDANTTSRTALGDTAYTAAYQHGAALNHDDAIHTALTDHLPPHPAHPHHPTHHTADHLTRRELDIIRLFNADPTITNKEMATRLYISTRTVDTHVAHILTKLALTSRTQIAIWATTHHDQ